MLPQEVIQMECDVFLDHIASGLEVLRRLKIYENKPTVLTWFRYRVAADSYLINQREQRDTERNALISEFMP